MSAETFDAAWLALRERADHRSRARALLPLLTAWWRERGCTSVLDLGAGAGSNLRYLAAELSGPQEWTLVDHDEGLLSRVKAPDGEVTLSFVCEDLSDGGFARLEPADLVTGSALLDLVSEEWISGVAEACSAAGAAALFALTYDGSVGWSGEADPMDSTVLAAVNRHQRGDKGFGPALGPAAGRAADEAFRARGYETRLIASPWELGTEDAVLIHALVDGWAQVTAEVLGGGAVPDEEERLNEWATRRSEDAAAGRSRLTVGHVDLLALPPDAAAP